MTLAPADRLRRYNKAFADIDAPFAFVDLEAMWANSDNMLGQIAGKPIRVASKSVRCRALLRVDPRPRRRLSRDADVHAARGAVAGV